MNNCLFPMKLHALVMQARKSFRFMNQRHHLSGMPDDEMERVMLLTPEMHSVFDKDFQGHVTRFRMAMFWESHLKVCLIEVYNDGGALLKQYLIEELNQEQALAIQAELMYAAIHSLGGYINPY